MARKSKNTIAVEASKAATSSISGGTPTGESKIPQVSGTARRSRRKESANVPSAETTEVVPETNVKRTSGRSRNKLQGIVEEPVTETKTARKNLLESTKKDTKEDLPSEKPLESPKNDEPPQKARRGRAPRSTLKEDTPDSSSVTENEDQQPKTKATAGRRAPAKKGIPPVPPVKATNSTPESKTPQACSTKKAGRTSLKVEETTKQTKVSPSINKSSKSRASAAAPETEQTPVATTKKKDTVAPVRSSIRSRKVVVSDVSEEKPSPSVERPSTSTAKRNASAAKLPSATAKRAKKDPVFSSGGNIIDATETSSAVKPVRRSRSVKPVAISSIQEESEVQTAILNQDEQSSVNLIARETSLAAKPVRKSRSVKPAEITSIQEENEVQTVIPNQEEQSAVSSVAMETVLAVKPVRRSRSVKPAEISSIQEEIEFQTAIPNQDEESTVNPSMAAQTKARKTVSNRRTGTRTTKSSKTSREDEEVNCSELKAFQTPQCLAALTSELVPVSAKCSGAKAISTTQDVSVELLEVLDVIRPSRTVATRKPVSRSKKVNNLTSVPEICPPEDAVPDAKQDAVPDEKQYDVQDAKQESVPDAAESSIAVLPKRASSRSQNGRKKTQGRSKALEPAFENMLDTKSLQTVDVACVDIQSSTLTVPMADITFGEIDPEEKCVTASESTTACHDNGVTKKRRGRAPNSKKNVAKQKPTVSESEMINNVPIVSEEKVIEHGFDLSTNEPMTVSQTHNQDMEIDSHNEQILTSHNADTDIMDVGQASVNDIGTIDFEGKVSTHASKKRSMPDSAHEAKRQKCSDDQIISEVSVIRRTPPRSAEPRPLAEREANRLTMSAMQIDWNADDITNSNDRLKHVGGDQIAALRKKALSFDALPVGFGLGISGWMTSSLLRQSIEENPNAENEMEMNPVDVSLPDSYHSIPCLKTESEVTMEAENLCRVPSMSHFSEEFKVQVKKQAVKQTKASMHLPVVSPATLDSEICKKVRSSPVATFIIAEEVKKTDQCRKTKAKAAAPCKAKTSRSRKL